MSGIIKVEPRKKTESPVKVNSKTDLDALLNVKKDCYAAIEKMEEQTEEFKAETQTALNQIDLRLAEADTNIEEAKKAATDAKEIAESLAGVEERVQGITDQAISDMNDIKQATEEIKLEAAAARNDAIDAATLSESWAKGGTGTRADEDTNNAKYWAEKAAEVAKVEIATTERAGIVKPDGTTIEVEPDGTIRVKGGNYVPASEKGAVNGVATLGEDGKVPTEQLPPISSDAKDITYRESNVESALDDRYTKAETDSLLYGENLLDNSDFKINQRGGKIVLAGKPFYSDSACTVLVSTLADPYQCIEVTNTYGAIVNPNTGIKYYVKAEDVVDGYILNAGATVPMFDRYWGWGGGYVYSLPNGGVHCNMNNDGLPSGSASTIVQKIDEKVLKGKTITISFRIENFSGSEIRLVLNNDWSIVKSVRGNGTFNFTFNIPLNQALPISFFALTNEEFDLFDLKFETGSVATPYIHPNPTLELLKCQRYYRKMYCLGVCGNDTGVPYIVIDIDTHNMPDLKSVSISNNGYIRDATNGIEGKVVSNSWWVSPRLKGGIGLIYGIQLDASQGLTALVSGHFYEFELEIDAE